MHSGLKSKESKEAACGCSAIFIDFSKELHIIKDGYL
jgi:hypothetical protein